MKKIRFPNLSKRIIIYCVILILGWIVGSLTYSSFDKSHPVITLKTQIYGLSFLMSWFTILVFLIDVFVFSIVKIYKKYNIRGVGVLFIVLATPVIGGIGYLYLNRNNSITSLVDSQGQQQEQSNNQSEKAQEQVIFDKMTEAEIKEYFQATEIVDNRLPNSIEFWTAAYCPGMGMKYEYKVPVGYTAYCDNTKQEEGTHGGCLTCGMARVSLEKNTTNESQENPSFIFEKGEAQLNPSGLTDDIFYSDKQLMEYVLRGRTFETEFEQKIQRGKFDVLNNNDVVLINIIASYEEADYFYVIEKGKDYSFISFHYSTHHIGTTIDVVPNYFINKGKPFFLAHDGGATSGGCVTININMLLYRIYNGLPKKVFSFTEYSMESQRESNDIYYEQSKNGFLTISGHINSFTGLCCNNFCDDPNQAIKDDIFKVFQWNEEKQIFSLVNQSIINSKYAELTAFKNINDIKFFFNAENIINNNLPEAITFMNSFGNAGCEEYIIPKGYKIDKCQSDDRHDYIAITLIKEN